MPAHMDYYEAVASQPENLVRSRSAVTAALAALDLAPWRTGLLAVAAMGASSHAGHALVERLARHGRRVVNLAASDLERRLSTVQPADAYVFISEGGRSRESIQAAQIAPAGRRMALTNGARSPLAALADAVVPLEHGPDSRVYTVGYTATLQALGLLATALDGADDGDDWDKLPETVAGALTEMSGPTAQIARMVGELHSIDVIGDGTGYCAAAEGALLIREATRITTGVYSTLQYVHGAMEPLNDRHGCILIGDGREVKLAHYISSRQIPCVLISSALVEENHYLRVLLVPPVAEISRAILEILPIQLISGELARNQNLDVNEFRYSQIADTKIDTVEG